MATTNWEKGSSGNANTSADWVGGSVPNGTDVKLPSDAAKPYTVTVTGKFNETSLNVGNGATLDSDVGGNVVASSLGTTNISLTGLIEATNGGKVTLGALTGEGTVYANGGTVVVKGVADDDTFYEINQGGSLGFNDQVGADRGNGSLISPEIKFLGAGTLNLIGEGSSAADDFLGNIANFDSTGLNDQVLLQGTSDGQDVLKVNYSGNSAVVDVVSDAANGSEEIARLVFDNIPSADHFVLTTTSAFGNVTDAITMVPGAHGEGSPICFLAGTMVATPAGEVAVENLKHGDIVFAADGREVPVIWVGKQTISMRFADPLRALPIRIKAGALDENVPARDLLVSPDHAMLVQGALIHAGAMVNGASIVRETHVPETFVYYHVEAEDHSIILAENAPAETFIDNVDRLGFDNWAEHRALYPEGRTVEELPYPRAKSARQIPVHVRVKLAERAQAIGADVSAVA